MIFILILFDTIIHGNRMCQCVSRKKMNCQSNVVVETNTCHKRFKILRTKNFVFLFLEIRKQSINEDVNEKCIEIDYGFFKL